jgi:hypothetical protein
MIFLYLKIHGSHSDTVATKQKTTSKKSFKHLSVIQQLD